MNTTDGESRLLLMSWLLLSAITVVLWWVGSSHGLEASLGNELLTTGVLLIAAVKVRVIINYFMEARHASTTLRRWMDGWLVFTVATLLAIYFLGLSIPPV